MSVPLGSVHTMSVSTLLVSQLFVLAQALYSHLVVSGIRHLLLSLSRGAFVLADPQTQRIFLTPPTVNH